LPVTVGTVISDKYRIDRIVGSGGMSIVLLAWHMELEQEVAIKILHGADVESDAAKRFRREARAAARIRSEHVSRVLDVGTLPSGSPYMVMEYLIGNDLAEELARRGPLPVDEIVLYTLQAIEALAEAHAAGIVHRDLKPENLFLALRADGTRAIKVLDFGISKSIAPSTLAEMSITKTASFVGSPLYMSPEQMRSSRSVDNRTDIWSLGAMLYEAVSGRLPYYAESIGELCTRLLQDSPPALGELRSGLPAGFEAVVLRCLEKERDRRYSTLGELARALAPFTAGGAVYADRAERVLAMGGLGMTGISKLSGTSISPTYPSPRSRSASHPSYASSYANSDSLTSRHLRSSEAAPAPRHSTPAWWAKTRASEVTRRKGPIAFGLVVGLGLGLAWAIGSNARHDHTQSSAQAARAAAPANPAVAAALPALDPLRSRAENGELPAPGLVTPAAPPTAAPAPEASREIERSSATASTRSVTTPARSITTTQGGPAPAYLSRARSSLARPIAPPSAKPEPAPSTPSSPAPEAEAAPRVVNAWDPSNFGGRH
jgi:serine/threonine-protein kinase